MTKGHVFVCDQSGIEFSFVILTWNSARYIEKCVSTIEQAMRHAALTYEILILDNGSSDGTPELLNSIVARSPGVVAYFEKTNTGTTKSRNRLLDVARGRYICVVDSDVELADGVCEVLADVLQKNPRVGLVAPRVHYPSGAWQKSFDVFPTFATKFNRLLRLREIEQREAQSVQPTQKPFFIDYAISAFWLMRREVLERVGKLDERIFYAPEDADFCLRIWKSGLGILYVPEVSVVHHTQEISRGKNLSRAKLSHIKGLAYYFLKHGYLLRKPRVERFEIRV